MSTTHLHPHDQKPTTSRCLRHHVWMAACADCREAHRVPSPRRAAFSGKRATR
ncbi:hypothetical protein QOZ88_07895 [Blastococcus sp. BMG 814]|uniref:Uncharacterized protein n=1 Tax=Blastococcus carthaginiensis TaxID=3050034 RepID=A0ABT9IAF7_9ACTN|nr:hypothetical protein [Blastococcus carthaginiensis]MDP5182558.1 hypothetical protein [Blastococcus carthaginiensis]